MLYLLDTGEWPGVELQGGMMGVAVGDIAWEGIDNLPVGLVGNCWLGDSWLGKVLDELQGRLG